jgi:hypothetical protein
VSLFLPFLVAASLYGEWLLAWWSLGHRPQPSLDDPKGIVGSSWMHGYTALAIASSILAALTAVCLNVAEIFVNRPPIAGGLIRVNAIVLSWSALFLLLHFDPGAVLYWWFD